jgi:AraC-like DNA-binding protein
MLASFIRYKRFQIKYINTKINAIDVSLKEKSIFNCPINLKSTETSITVSQSNYLKKSSISNPKLISYLSSIAIKSLEERAVNTTLTEKIENLMSNYENHYNNISIQEISNQLGISVNTLRNHLSRDKTTFRQVFNNYKLNKSKNMLKEDLSVKVVSYKLGYSDPSSFIRWFISQTQLTPTSYKIGLKT